MTSETLTPKLAIISLVVWGSVVLAQEAANPGGLLQDAQTAANPTNVVASAATNAVPVVAPAPAAPEATPAAPEAAVPVPAVAAIPPKEMEATPADAKELARQEELRRRALAQQAGMELKAGDAALSEDNYLEAAKSYELAIKHLLQVSAPAATVADVSNKVASAYGLAAAQELKRGDENKALTLASSALGFDKHERHAVRVNAAVDKRRTLATQPQPLSKREDIKAEKISIQEKLVEGRQYFELKKYDEAEARFDKVLSVDPYNRDAMRFLRRIGEVRFDLSTTEREATVVDMMNSVRDHWNPHIRKESTVPKIAETKTSAVEPSDVMRTRQKLQQLIIPQIEFRQANIVDVLDTLSKISVEVDPEKVGVNIILKVSSTQAATPPAGAEGAAATPAPDAAATPAPDAAATPAAGNIPPVTMNLRKVNLLDAIKYVTELANLGYRIDKNVVFITPRGVDPSSVVTRLYPVSPSVISAMSEKAAGAPAATLAGAAGAAAVAAAPTAPAEGASGKSDLSTFFDSAGVSFPPGTSIKYNSAISKLIVSHTPEMQEKIENLLAELDVATKQVEIEARFVDVNENALEEFGFQWALTNPYTVASNNQYSNPSMNQRVQINPDSQGFTKGLRFFNFDPTATLPGSSTIGAPVRASTVTSGIGQTPMGNVLTFASVLTNPELQMAINALEQKGHADVLSVPRVTTKNSEQAVIKVVEEIRYPQSYEANQVQVPVLGVGVGAVYNITVFTPADFQTRDVGVLLTVTPTIGPDGYTIDLTLVPEVSELVEWHQYGTTIGAGQNFNAQQPFFQTRTVTSKLVVWDGETVVLGGLIREQLTDFKDKIPVLGDIPLLGKLFQSKGASSTKENLMIFVTARIVDSSGRPIHRKEKPTLTSRETTKGQTAAPPPTP